jgi:hypothetical protein
MKKKNKNLNNKLGDAIIGYSGYIGSYLNSKKKVRNLYNSNNIEKIKNKKFKTVYLAAPDSIKYLANKYPEKDKKRIKKLLLKLKNLNCKRIIYFSTIDVLNICKSNYYGANRLLLEKFIKKNFKTYLIIRLPSLFGWKLKKNYFFDIINFKSLKFYNSKTRLQWYFLENILKDIRILKKKKIRIANLVSPPITCMQLVKYLKHNIYDFENSIHKYSYDEKFQKRKYFSSKREILNKMKNIYKTTLK